MTQTGNRLLPLLGLSLALNTASSLLGILLIPLAGIGWEIFPGLFIYSFFDTGTFNPGTWTTTIIMAVLITTTIEAAVIRYAFKERVSRWQFGGIAFANAITVGIAFWSLLALPW